MLANVTLQQVELAARRQELTASMPSQAITGLGGVSAQKTGISPAMLAAVNFTSQLINMPMSIFVKFPCLTQCVDTNAIAALSALNVQALGLNPSAGFMMPPSMQSPMSIPGLPSTIGLSSVNPAAAAVAANILSQLSSPCTVNYSASYNLFSTTLTNTLWLCTTTNVRASSNESAAKTFTTKAIFPKIVAALYIPGLCSVTKHGN